MDNAFKGHIANVTKVSEKPFVKYEGRYFCFSPILPYRNLFKIVENLVKSDNKYYKNHFLVMNILSAEIIIWSEKQKNC